MSFRMNSNFMLWSMIVLLFSKFSSSSSSFSPISLRSNIESFKVMNIIALSINLMETLIFQNLHQVMDVLARAQEMEKEGRSIVHMEG